MFGEVVYQFPIEIFIHIAESMTLLRKNQHIKTFPGTNQCINYP